MRTHRLSRNNIHTYWSRGLEPRLMVTPGDIVIFETLDSGYGRVGRSIADLAQPGVDPSLLALIADQSYPVQSTVDRDPGLDRGHALTGPVSVEGAQPGDTLVLEVVRVEPAAWGFTRSGSYHHIWDLRSGEYAEFRPGIRVPLAPFCGIMGVAPAEWGQHSTIPPGPHGGNLDLRHLTAGSTLHLPVLVPNALLSIGDVHAAQGDGEVSGTAIETEATVTVRVELLHGTGLAQPQVLTSGGPLSMPGRYHVSVGSGPDLLGAARMALEGTLEYLGVEHGLKREEGMVLASACMDLKVSQLVNLPHYTVSGYLPLGIFA